MSALRLCLSAESHRRLNVIDHPLPAFLVSEIVEPQPHAGVSDLTGQREFSIKRIAVKVSPDLMKVFTVRRNVVDAANGGPIRC